MNQLLSSSSSLVLILLTLLVVCCFRIEAVRWSRRRAGGHCQVEGEKTFQSLQDQGFVLQQNNALEDSQRCYEEALSIYVNRLSRIPTPALQGGELDQALAEKRIIEGSLHGQRGKSGGSVDWNWADKPDHSLVYSEEAGNPFSNSAQSSANVVLGKEIWHDAVLMRAVAQDYAQQLELQRKQWKSFV